MCIMYVYIYIFNMTNAFDNYSGKFREEKKTGKIGA